MTSSLVGSEMCIRDRISTVARKSIGDSGAPRGVPHSVRTSWEVTPPNLAVSYTHLTLPTICSV
eukprot:3242730-Prorocentrum_lima.AAC.1